MKSQIILPSPPKSYDVNDQAQMRRAIAAEDLNNIKVNDYATALLRGIVKIGAGITVTADGTISAVTYSEGTWTPADASGASLALTVNHAVYKRVGTLVFIQADVTYPTTANGANASWSGLPVAAASNGQGTAIVMSNSMVAALGGTAGGASTVVFLMNTGSNQINSNLSTVHVRFSGWYSTN